MGKVRLLVAASSLGLVTCHGALFTASPGSTLQLIANPGFISANGGVALITAIVTEAAGTFVPDGTVVLFFTDLGRIEPQARTKDGIARVNLIADSRSGTATVTAISGGPAPAVSTPTPTPGPTPTPTPTPATRAPGTGSDTVAITIGNLNAQSILMTVFPAQIGSSRSTFVTATVFDASGNTLQGAPVFFSVIVNPATESFNSGGAPIFTDNDGRATDVLRTSRAFPAVARGSASVQARVPGTGGTFVTGGPLTVPID